MATSFIFPRDVKIAICDAFGIDHKRHNVTDVGVSSVSGEMATVIVRFLLTKEVIKIILNKEQ